MSNFPYFKEVIPQDIPICSSSQQSVPVFSIYGWQQADKAQQTAWKVQLSAKKQISSFLELWGPVPFQQGQHLGQKERDHRRQMENTKAMTDWRQRNIFHTCKWCRVSGDRSLSRLFALSFCGLTGCLSFRDVLLPRRPVCFPSDLLERGAFVLDLAHDWAKLIPELLHQLHLATSAMRP